MCSDEQSSSTIACIDRRVGKRLRLLRTERGISLTRMAAVIGVSYQQVQKYEAGKNRMAASVLYGVATHFRVSIAWFFKDGDES